jgi:uncharacterized protein (TIGR00290 family)
MDRRSGVKKVLLSWSSGKDCAWALHLLRQQAEVEVMALLTTLNGAFNRVAMHGVRRDLVDAQADRTGLPLWAVDLPWPCSNAEYEETMRGVCARAVSEGITAIAFGDLFLEDIREYRVRQLRGTGLDPVFPVWQIPTETLARDMIGAGVKARITCLNPSRIPAKLAGAEYDGAFLNALPATADPCGENGEFHSFVYDAPVFARPIKIQTGEVVERDGFVFADLLNARSESRQTE